MARRRTAGEDRHYVFGIAAGRGTRRVTGQPVDRAMPPEADEEEPEGTAAAPATSSDEPAPEPTPPPPTSPDEIPLGYSVP